MEEIMKNQNSETKTIKDYLETKDKNFLTLLDKYLSGDKSVTKEELEYSSKIALQESSSMTEKFNELLECYPKDKPQAEEKFQELLDKYINLGTKDSINHNKSKPIEYFKDLKSSSKTREQAELDNYPKPKIDLYHEVSNTINLSDEQKIALSDQESIIKITEGFTKILEAISQNTTDNNIGVDKTLVDNVNKTPVNKKKENLKGKGPGR